MSLDVTNNLLFLKSLYNELISSDNFISLSKFTILPAFVSSKIVAKSPFSGPMAKIGLLAVKYSNNFPVKIPSLFNTFGINNNKT